MHTFYVIYSPSIDSYYIGSTSDEPSERLRRHNANHSGYTGRASDWGFVHTEQFETKAEAMNREREVKAWKSRRRIVELIGA